MSKKYPFHYEVRFKLLAFDKENNVRNETYTKLFNDNNPLESRAKAFDAFEEYLSFLKQVKRIKLDNQGNPYIIQPSFIAEILNKKEEYNDRHITDQYKEEISVYLVVDDPDVVEILLNEIQLLNFSSIDENLSDLFKFTKKNKNEFEIHKVASFEIEPQDIIDNLDMYEVPLYEHFQINVDDLIETVYHYGLDYGESGEDEESGAKRTILKTPLVWNSIECYNERNKSHGSINETEPKVTLDWLTVIKRGESHQVEFKPSLLYNFKTKAAGISVKYIIAKAICAFLNSSGGVLLIGVKDNGDIQGLEDSDYSLFPGDNSKDKMLLEVDSLLAYFFSLSIAPFVNASIENLEGKDILVIVVSKSDKPIFLKNKRYDVLEKEFYIRMHASTRQIVDIEEIIEYVFNNN